MKTLNRTMHAVSKATSTIDKHSISGLVLRRSFANSFDDTSPFEPYTILATRNDARDSCNIL